jgi:hypothetical protein
MEREYGVVLTTRSGSAYVIVTAERASAAKAEARTQVPCWRVGRSGGQVFTSAHVDLLSEYGPGIRERFIPLAEAVETITRNGFVNWERAS